MRGRPRSASAARRATILVHLAVAFAAWAAVASAVPRRTRIPVKLQLLTAGESGEGGDGAVFTGDEANRLRQLVTRWHQEVEAGNANEADAILAKVETALEADAVTYKKIVLGALVAIGQDWMLADHWENAERAFKAALQLDASFAPAQLAQASLAWKRDRDVIGTMGGVLAATGSRLATTKGLILLAAGGSLIGLAALLIAVSGVALVFLVKFNRLLRHGLEELFTDRVPAGVDRWLAWCVVFAPVVLFLDPPIWIVYWLILFGGYGSRGERLLTAACLFGLALVPIGFAGATWLSALPGDPVVRAVGALEERDVTPAVVADFRRFAEEQGSEAKFLLARLYSAAGQDGEALATYDALIARDKRDVRAMVNRGNINFKRRESRRAVADYKQATDTDRRMVLAWRNGGIAYTQLLETETATDWQQRALALDADAVRSWRQEVGPDRMKDAELTASEVRRLVLASRGDLRSRMFSAAVNRVSVFALLGLAFVLVRLKSGRGLVEASACEKCGRSFCSRCHATARNSAYCTQCVHLYVKKDGVSPEVRTAKLREVEKWVAVNSIAIRLFNLALPGSGGLYANRMLTGGALLLCWSTAMAALALPTYLVMDPVRLGHLDLSILFMTQLAALVVVYLVALWQSLRH